MAHVDVTLRSVGGRNRSRIGQNVSDAVWAVRSDTPDSSVDAGFGLSMSDRFPENLTRRGRKYRRFQVVWHRRQASIWGKVGPDNLSVV